MAGSCSGEKRIASPRQKRLPDALSEYQIRRLLSGIRSPVHKACLAVMYACGLRISEATTLEIGSVDRANRVLRIIGKGDKERLVPLPQPILDDLGHLWRTHHNRLWLFPNHRGDAPLNNRVLSRTFADAARTADIPRGVTPTRFAPQLCNSTNREWRGYPRRTDPAWPRQHRHHCHLHPPDHAHPGVTA